MFQSHKRLLLFESIVLHAVLFMGLVISVFPFYWMIISSLKGRGEVFVLPPRWWVTDPIFRNYLTVFEKTNFATGFLNSCFVTFVKTFTALFFSAMAGFAFAKYEFPGKNGLFLFLLGTMMIPGVVTLIPTFMVIVRIGWVDTYQALIVPGLASAFGTFLMRQYMLTIPDELLDAGRIDGASEFRLFFQIILPIVLPAAASLAIYAFFGNWNELFWPIIVIRTKPKFTLPLSLMLLRSRFPLNVDYSVLFAASFMATLPTLIVFFTLQRYFISGIATGAIKA
ncbi:MAG: carbohydrate ABC transporter permease [Anaerolineae bacterium]|nr:carbohydrate ABC transporter permease [Anaerolineae bacterium]